VPTITAVVGQALCPITARHYPCRRDRHVPACDPAELTVESPTVWTTSGVESQFDEDLAAANSCPVVNMRTAR
jgi:hypothetical protein